MRLLVIEDEQKTSTFLKKGLSEHGFVVDIADNGVDGLHLAQTEKFDAVILDAMVPKLDGFSLLRRLRQDGHPVPVLFLTAKAEIADRVQGLELGADDYVIKPFAFSELIARLRTILRRGTKLDSEAIQIGDLVLDVAKHKVSRMGQRLELTPKEFLLLSLLARNAGEVLSRTVIAEQVWDINFNSDTNVVEVHMRRLRTKVDEPFEKKLIHTVRGVGYVLEERE